MLNPNPGPSRIARRRLFRAAGLLVILSLPGVAPPVAAASTSEPEMLRLQEEIGIGFTQGEADRIARLLSPRMKTYVACRMLADDDGYYGTDQLRLLMRRLFRSRATTGFRVVKPATERPDGQAVMQAIWTFRESGAAAADIRLAFTLSREAGAWRLREIRDLT